MHPRLMEIGLHMQKGYGIQRIPCVYLQIWTWLQRERGQSGHLRVATTTAQQVKSAGRIPTALLTQVLVTEAKT